MKAIIGFVQTHLISLICGVVTLAAFGVAMLGMSSQDAVVSQMTAKKSAVGADSIGGLRSSAKNQTVIDKEKLRGKYFTDDYNKTIEAAKNINQRQPLMGGVFPKPEQAAYAYAFKSAYAKEIERLPVSLSADTLPTEADRLEEVENVQELLLQAKEIKEETKVEGAAAPAVPAAASPGIEIGGGEIAGDFGGGRFGGGGGRFGGEMVGGRGMGMGIQMQSGPATEPKYDPVLRAQINKAKSIRCYIDPNTFQTDPLVNMQAAPSPAQMWYAQVGLWIQQDVVSAIAGLNREAAKAVQDGEAYVEQSPVKRIIAVRVLGYIIEAGTIQFPGAGAEQHSAAAAPTPSFTAARSNDLFDVVRFETTLVVDQRELLKVIDALTKANFNKLLSIEYTAVDRKIDETQLGYYYGTAPCIQVRMEFETYMARDSFDPMKPEEVVAALAGKKPGE
ncbi:MAG: hypothetical protein HZB38_15590 [Planctomycetes bacterium]|nr:hypothetical protein [Planctomycetota bacterium]